MESSKKPSEEKKCGGGRVCLGTDGPKEAAAAAKEATAYCIETSQKQQQQQQQQQYKQQREKAPRARCSSGEYEQW
ncbi:hypothetical protein PV325_008368 [Microctonus aethiopoides]|nr:hypothetical protein PV325_008368 [Microctonus aethiopoides]